MSVNTNGIAIYAHESLTIDEIISIIVDDDDLQSKVSRSFDNATREVLDDLDVESLDTHLDRPYILVRTKGTNKDAMRERMRMPKQPHHP